MNIVEKKKKGAGFHIDRNRRKVECTGLVAIPFHNESSVIYVYKSEISYDREYALQQFERLLNIQCSLLPALPAKPKENQICIVVTCFPFPILNCSLIFILREINNS